jgi:hypothetical protein
VETTGNYHQPVLVGALVVFIYGLLVFSQWSLHAEIRRPGTFLDASVTSACLRGTAGWIDQGLFRRTTRRRPFDSRFLNPLAAKARD